MTESVGDLRKIAEAATPGPWITDSLESGEHGVFVEEGNPDYRKLGCASAIVASHLVGKNAEYLEAFDPGTALALLSRLEQAEQAVQRVRAMAQDWEANGNSCAVGDRSADVWHATANAILRALDGDTRRLADDALGGDNNG